MTASARVAELHDFFMYEYKCSMCDGTHEYSTFCKECVQLNLKNRSRKCPGCGTGFGQDDVIDLFL